MSERDIDTDDYQDGFVPEHLRYIDEKEALEHKKQKQEEDEEKETLENEAEMQRQLKRMSSRMDSQTNFPPIFTRNRFTCKIPEHFLCKICSNVVKDPQECLSCENLLCKACIKSVSQCPFGCDTFKVKQIAKFAANMYFALTLDCKNKPFGCPYSNSIKNVMAHEDTCQYVVTQCENSLCDRYILKKDKNRDPGAPLLCSEICENLIQFSLVIDEDNKIETLQKFTALSERCKKLIEYEVKADLQDKHKRIEQHKKEAEMYKKQKEKLEKDITTWQNCHHPGKWNLRTLKWTCCGANDIVALGCKNIS